jgi:hypothetical protein
VILVFFLRFQLIDMKFTVGPDHAYVSLYGRFRIQMLKEGCLCGKEPLTY